jgi:hypothetical protein
LRAAEEALTERISSRLTVESVDRIAAVVAVQTKKTMPDLGTAVPLTARMACRSWGRSRRLRAM